MAESKGLSSALSSVTSVSKEQLERLSAYFAEQNIFIVDPSGVSRRRLASLLVDMGAKRDSVSLYSTIEEAEHEIKDKKPKVIITDFSVGKRTGLDLIPPQKTLHPDARDTLFLLVTGNTSQSAVARAAEEDVDRFILKPYTVSSFVNTLALAFVEKLFPNEYRKTVENGKTLLFAGKIDEAMQVFEKAMEMDPSPSLACFYYGQAEILKQAYLDAQGSYLKGLNYNRIHYKCLIGLYELLMQREMYAEAYAVIRRMQKYFPANPKRFASVIRLAVVNRKFADIEQLYSVFTEMEFREREVMRYMCAGLVVSAQHAFSADSKSTHAEDLLKKVAVSCAGDPYFLRRVIEVLSENKRPDTMQGVLSRFPPDLQKSPDFLVSSFLHLDLTAAPGVSLQAGQALLRDGHHMPFVYRTLCRRYLELGKKDQAEDILREGIRRFPKEYSVFRPLVEMVPQVKKELNIA